MVLKVDFLDGDAVVWHVTPDGVERARDADYTPTLYVYADDPSDLDAIHDHVAALPMVADVATERHRPGFRHDAAPMLRVDVAEIGRVTEAARQLRGWGDIGQYRLYDVDLSPEFRYCLETAADPAPDDCRDLATLELAASDPALAADHLTALAIDGERVEGATTILDRVTERLAARDPDLLVVSHAAVVPSLFELAAAAGRPEFALGRGPGYQQRAGRSTYTSYGRVAHSPARYNVPGRALHNESNSFLRHESNLAGCLDLVARSGKPLQELGWASIGNVLTAIQIRKAHELDVRVPWNSWRHEFFKPMGTLDDADRGGFTFAPAVGVHDDVHELDFSSLYPNVMVTRNLSPETVRCDCCDTDDVPGLGYSVCGERDGYLADVLGPIIDDRRDYKRQLETATDPERVRALKGRAAALKWILVSCFGYQGFSNAKFGRIECHEAINAYAREILLDAKETLEANGWRVVHGIVDSLWVTGAPDIAPDERTDLEAVAAEISDAIDIELEYERAYDWIAFVPMRDSDAGALTKYFGRAADAAPDDASTGDPDDDAYKYRGIECRQRSTPPFVASVQRELIRAFDAAREPAAVCDRLQRRLEQLAAGDVDATRLLVTQRVSKTADEYDQRTRAVATLERAAAHGIDRHPGESIRYLVVDDDRRARDRVRLAFEVDPDTAYDAVFYRELLLRAAESVLAPAGWRQRDIERYLADRVDAAITAY